MEPEQPEPPGEQLREFVDNPNSTRAELEQKAPGIVERAEGALEKMEPLSKSDIQNRIAEIRDQREREAQLDRDR